MFLWERVEFFYAATQYKSRPAEYIGCTEVCSLSLHQSMCPTCMLQVNLTKFGLVNAAVTQITHSIEQFTGFEF